MTMDIQTQNLDQAATSHSPNKDTHTEKERVCLERKRERERERERMSEIETERQRGSEKTRIAHTTCCGRETGRRSFHVCVCVCVCVCGDQV